MELKKVNGKWKSTYLNQIRQPKLVDQEYSCYDCGVELISNPHELHHIVPVHEDKSKAFTYTNIVALCKKCHASRHKTQGWQGGTYLYGKPELVTSIKSKGITKTYDLEIAGDYPNFIANGVVVHNSRNASSSRAIPTDKLLLAARKVEGYPVFWGSNKPGMQAGDELKGNELKAVRDIWEDAANSAADFAEKLMGLGLHKQITNRLLEPFLNIKVLVTATDWDNFKQLRSHPDAQPEIRVVSDMIGDAMRSSDPVYSEYGTWHLPYISEKERDELDLATLRKCSAARCARVSYLNHDASTPQVHKDLELFNMLVTRPYALPNGNSWSEHDPIHASPTEHQAVALEPDSHRYTHEYRDGTRYSGNLRGWVQFRQIL